MSDRCHAHGTRCCQTCEPPNRCTCQIVGWSRDPAEPHIPAQAEWERADNCPMHPLAAPADAGSTPDDRDARSELLDLIASADDDWAGSPEQFGFTWVHHIADAILASDWLAEHDRRVAAKALRDALGGSESPQMVRAMLWDAADRLSDPAHKGNRHPWPEHAAMFRNLADRIEADTHDVRDDLQREFGGGL